MFSRWRTFPIGLAVSLLGPSAIGCGDIPITPIEIAKNLPPRIATPLTVVDHDILYHQPVSVWDQNGDTVTVEAATLPDWLEFFPDSLILSGVPGLANLGEHSVVLVASDGIEATTHAFTLTVKVGLTSLEFDGSWVSAGMEFGHDGTPYESDNFVVHSGFSSWQERQYIADVLEQRFIYLGNSLQVSSHDEYQYPDDTERIDVLALRLQGVNVLWTGQSYRYGIVVHAPDSPRYVAEGYTRDLYTQLLTHELMHVVEYLLVGTEHDYSAVEKWFHEGMATYIAGPPPNQVTTTSQLTSWQAAKRNVTGQGNPVSVKTWSHFPVEIINNAAELGRYYLFFELAVRYLVDPDGYGKTLLDVKNIYLDIRAGTSFSVAFETRMGMSVREYEASFFERAEAYLSN